MSNYDVQANLDVANTIAEQIGGRAFLMMGTKIKLGGEKSLTFDIHGCRDYSKIRVSVVMDTYTVEFFKFRKFEIVKHKIVERVYCDNLNAVIEGETGLRLSL